MACREVLIYAEAWLQLRHHLQTTKPPSSPNITKRSTTYCLSLPLEGAPSTLTKILAAMSQYCFPYPKDSDVPPLGAPYIATRQYSLAGEYTFETYYINILPNELQSIIGGAKHPEVRRQINETILMTLPPSASCVQEWLFFGLASESLGRDIKHDEFLDSSTIDIRISRWFWTELRGRWKRLHCELSGDAYRRKLEHLKKCCELAKTTLFLIDVIPQSDANYNAEEHTSSALVNLSVHMLLYTIMSSGIFRESKVTCAAPQLKSARLLLERMAASSGWCRKRLNFVQTGSSRPHFPVLYFLSSLQPRRAMNEDHQPCTSNSCTVKTQLVEPLHRTPDCACKDVQIPLEPVLKIVDFGGIPLVRIRRSPSGEFQLEVVPYVQGLKFLAISHVWADRQLGSTQNAVPSCQVEYLQSILASVPSKPGMLSYLLPNSWRLPSSLDPRTVAEGKLNEETGYPLNEWYFWLDTFCIPQHEDHSQLRNEAIGSMNLIYAAASRTVVLDSGLQTYDAGQSPRSEIVNGRYTFNAPADPSLLDVTAHLCASNWMGRAWTLQEAVLSKHLIFPFKGSFANLRMLRPNDDDGLSFSSFADYIKRQVKKAIEPEASVDMLDETWEFKGKEPLWDHMRREMLSFAKTSLNVDDHGNYARGLADRSASFVNAHARLQSRTTTMTKDLPLILMNMSGMNGNLISRSESSEEKVKLLFYSLGNLPVEFLFTECARLGNSCEVDAWIPTEVAPVSFAGNHVLRLDATGFNFHSNKSDEPLEFYFISRSATWDTDVIINIPDDPDEEERRYIAKPSPKSTGKMPSNCYNGWCILFAGGFPLDEKHAVRFIINRRVGNTVFLNFDCTMHVSLAAKDEPHYASGLPSYIGRPADSSQRFVLSRSETDPESLSMSRPQNPSQYSDRLGVISQFLYFGSGFLERGIWDYFFGDANALIGDHWITVGIPYVIYNIKKHDWIEKGLHAIVHRAWLATYSPDWDPNGPWRWFWKVFNFEPWIPFKEINKIVCKILFSIYMTFGIWTGVAQITFYWMVVYPMHELLGMYVISLSILGLMRLFV